MGGTPTQAPTHILFQSRKLTLSREPWEEGQLCVRGVCVASPQAALRWLECSKPWVNLFESLIKARRVQSPPCLPRECPLQKGGGAAASAEGARGSLQNVPGAVLEIHLGVHRAKTGCAAWKGSARVSAVLCTRESWRAPRENRGKAWASRDASPSKPRRGRARG